MSSIQTALYILIILIFNYQSSCKRSDSVPMSVKTVHNFRITKYGDCPNFSDKPHLYDVKIMYQNNQHYLSAKYNWTDFYAKRIAAIIDRCVDYEYVCEYFQTWNTSDYCLFAKMKNQAWSDMFESVTPRDWRDTCPRIKKGTYEIHNATVKADTILLFYPQAKNYHWRIRMLVYDQSNQAKYCYYLSFYIVSYTKKLPILTNT